MTADAHIFSGYNPRPIPKPNIETALNNARLQREGLGNSITKQQLQSDLLAYDEALRLSIADRDELRLDRGAFTVRAVVQATEAQQSYIAQLEALKDAAIRYVDGDISLNQLNDAVLTYAETNLGADK